MIRVASGDRAGPGGRVGIVMLQLDPDSGEWVSALTGTLAQREAAVNRLHPLLVRIARAETRRRASTLQVTGPELDDLAHQAAADALLAITANVGQFRGDGKSGSCDRPSKAVYVYGTSVSARTR